MYCGTVVVGESGRRAVVDALKWRLVIKDDVGQYGVVNKGLFSDGEDGVGFNRRRIFFKVCVGGLVCYEDTLFLVLCGRFAD